MYLLIHHELDWPCWFYFYYTVYSFAWTMIDSSLTLKPVCLSHKISRSLNIWRKIIVYKHRRSHADTKLCTLASSRRYEWADYLHLSFSRCLASPRCECIQHNFSSFCLQYNNQIWFFYYVFEFRPYTCVKTDDCNVGFFTIINFNIYVNI